MNSRNGISSSAPLSPLFHWRCIAKSRRIALLTLQGLILNVPYLLLYLMMLLNQAHSAFELSMNQNQFHFPMRIFATAPETNV